MRSATGAQVADSQLGGLLTGGEGHGSNPVSWGQGFPLHGIFLELPSFVKSLLVHPLATCCLGTTLESGYWCYLGVLVHAIGYYQYFYLLLCILVLPIGSHTLLVLVSILEVN